MTHKSLIKNIPTPDQQWKAPVKVWVRDLYEKKFGRVLTVNPALNEGTSGKRKKQEKPSTFEFFDDDDLPF